MDALNSFSASSPLTAKIASVSKIEFAFRDKNRTNCAQPHEPLGESMQRLSRPIREYQEVGIFLAPQFSLYGLIPLIEVFRVANQNAGKRLFNWSFISENGSPVESGAGMSIGADTSIYSDFHFDLVFVYSGNDATSYLSKRLVSWLQRLNAHGVILAGVDTGAFALAEAGLLKGRRATCHWEAMPLFSERYPDSDIVERRYIIDPPFITCAGGISVLDMVLDLIEREYGAVLARHISNGFVYPHQQRGDGPQRSSAGAPRQEAPDPVSRAVRLMEANIESPLSVAQIAEQLNQPRRNVERIFRKKTDSSIGQYYMRVRLERAREMLFYSSEAISEISLLCGFSSPAIFTRTFRAHFGQSPSEFRIARHLVAERISKLQEITRGSEDRSIYCRNMQIRNPRPEASL
jgi:AraC family carnitine catabolism transcriptional activator